MVWTISHILFKAKFAVIHFYKGLFNWSQVSVEYRLGVLGFLTLESDDAPGNLGLRDQALALDFIKREVRQSF